MLSLGLANVGTRGDTSAACKRIDGDGQSGSTQSAASPDSRNIVDSFAVYGVGTRPAQVGNISRSHIDRTGVRRIRSTSTGSSSSIFLDAAIRSRYQPKPQPAAPELVRAAESLQRHSVALRHVRSGDSAPNGSEAIWS